MIQGMCILIALLLGVALLPAQTGTILSVEFDGNSSIDGDQLRSHLRFLRPGSSYRAAVVGMELESLRRCYLDEGFLKVEIGEPRLEQRSEGGRESGIAARIRVTEGPRYLLGELAIAGNTVFSTATLLQMAPLHPGQPYSRRKLEEWREKVVDSYRSMGYIQFEGDLNHEVKDVLRKVDVALECREGQAFRVGHINVVTDSQVDAATFRRRLLVGEGGLYNPEMLVLSRHFLNQSGLFQPIGESDVEVKIDDSSGTVDITFRVTPLRKPESQAPARE
jgi:outer membrane protein insertion porin family